MPDVRDEKPGDLPLFRQAAVIAPGLLGGSLALACRERGLAGRVVGMARRQETIDRGLALGAFDAGVLDLAEAVREADLVIVAAPVRATIQLLGQLAPHVPPGCVVTDVGSTKTAIMDAARECLPPGQFIGGHPMAGSHESGIGAARSTLFEGAVYLLCEDGETPAPARTRLEEFVRRLGARPVWLGAADHDLLVARISHLPHLAACALVECAAYRVAGTDALDLAATGFRDTTRVAAGHPSMWTDICLTNRAAILESLDAYTDSLTRLRARIEQLDEAALGAWMEETARVRGSI